MAPRFTLGGALAAGFETIGDSGHVRGVAEEALGKGAHRDRLVRIEHPERVCLGEAEPELGERRTRFHALRHADLEEELLRFVCRRGGHCLP